MTGHRADETVKKADKKGRIWRHTPKMTNEQGSAYRLAHNLDPSDPQSRIPTTACWRPITAGVGALHRPNAGKARSESPILTFARPLNLNQLIKFTWQRNAHVVIIEFMYCASISAASTNRLEYLIQKPDVD
jgi:hypothetical protein